MAVEAGAVDLGENRVQEAVAKKPEVPGANWHLIGPLQRNKARAALEVFDIVHTLDRPELADRLQLLLAEHWPGRRLDVLVEANIGSEPQKAGALPEEVAELVRHSVSCDRLSVRGLMAIPPWQEDPEASRPYFRALRELRDDLQQVVGVPLPELSMGMSHDFDVAIAEGATMVRVGTAIFGSRG
jgi:pyridoxal phosphate enzyme (YggS family)